MIRTFDELEAFQRAYRLSLEVHRSSLGWPRVEQTGLADQVRRSSKSICANVAEGWGKQAHSKKEFNRFLYMAIGSCDEMRVWVRYCRDLGYVEAAVWHRWSDEYREIAKMLQGLSRKLATPASDP